ncbi:MAG TPA: hypothetical protein VI197_33650 [Polyangiaceae bacterium]
MTYQKAFLKNLVQAAAVAALTFSGVAAADVPEALTQQGRLLDSSGAAVPDGEISFTFSIYDTADGGTALWSETQDISTEDGYFSAQLGESEAFPANLFDGGTTLYLGVQVGSDDEMTPRQLLTSVPFAMKAGLSDNATNAENAENATNAQTAVNVTGDITPSSIETGAGTFTGAVTASGGLTVTGGLTANNLTVNGAQVINSAGVWVGQVDFTDIVDRRPTVAAAAGSQSNSCLSGGNIVSGGCAVTDASDWIMQSYPAVAKSGTNSWVCACGGTGCTVVAHAVCLQ